MARILYELSGADENHRFSPFVWRIRMALAHKGLDYEGVPVRFTEKDKIEFSGQARVPILVDGDQTIHDSWSIACYLEDTYADRPSLFRGDGGRQGAFFVKNWYEGSVMKNFALLMIPEVYKIIHEKDRDYFRTTREKVFGAKLEELCPDPEKTIAAIRQSLTPMRTILEGQPYLGGEEPTFMDYVPFAAFMWARCVSTHTLLAEDDPLYAWRERLLDRFDGLARKVPPCP